MFIRHALVAGDWETRHAFVGANARFVERVALLEARVRRIDLLDDEAVFGFYDERIAPEVTSGRDFDRWWKSAARDGPNVLDLGPAALQNRGGIRLDDYPDTWTIDGAEYRLTYRFEPDTPLDGATLNVPLTALNQLSEEGLDWLVAGYREELVGMLIRSLPKEIRRELIPMNETAAAVFERLGEPSGRLVDAVAAAVRDVAGVQVTGDDLDVARLPSHLRVHFVVHSDDGAVLDAGDDLEAIRDRQAGSARTALAAAAPIEERRDIVSWDIGTLDQVVERRADDGHVVRAFPTLLDRGDSVALRVVDNEGLQRRAMHGGVRRLLLMAAAPTVPKVERTLDRRATLAVAAGSIPLSDLAADAIEAAVDAVMARYELPWDDGAFARIEQAVRQDAPQLAADALAVAADIVDAASRVLQRTAALPAEALRATVADAEAHVRRLVAPGFVRRSGAERLPDVHRYVRGIEYRLDHLGGDVARDQRRMAEVRPIERSVAAAADGAAGHDHDGRELAWMIEELRMSTFAQPLGVDGPVSAKRIRQAFRSITGTNLD
jgi:ATP-dependent helicase HrpA